MDNDYRAALLKIKDMHDRDHECHDGGWVKPDRVYGGGEDVAPEWPCRTLVVVLEALPVS